MDTDAFWHLIETARSRATESGTFDEALVDLLALRSEREVLAYQERFEELLGALYRWDVWAAADLIGGGCSDDGFTDFRAGVIAQGRTWYERVAADPDSLAGHPLVAAAAGAGDRHVLFYEAVNYVAPAAFERLTGDEEDFYAAWERWGWEARPGDAAATDIAAGTDMGEDVDVRDADQVHRRLPRLAALHLPADLAPRGPRTPTGPTASDGTHGRTAG
ncbi:Protein of unknown function [Streptomyces sp. DvalAA-14]|uniref:DUF4240 domain-containing protein n=1 Tax=unclassified Streptomyces TaxID=2593676 RepID=UPI00081BBAB8|nr:MULTISPECIES: DUF4240 domain-containing protein [unclassified Streptomyces]MYS23642.1 DUF4240 domain-containing protein [Streptomyces sp. SID4948]SCE36575.1 Protein of unknown function [Streptomyces sp. DvalAA-14]